MNPSLSLCPVPEDQRPLNEYQELKESWFFGWALGNLSGYVRPLLVLWGLSWLIFGPIAAASYAPARQPLQFGLFAAIGASVLPVLALLRLYLGWNYVRSRLLNPTVFYEESGWYDGQTWVKPAEVLMQDRLIVTYQVQPILQRLTRTFWVMGAIGVSMATWLWLEAK
jgi:Conserved in the green lineage and diatoms 27